VFSVRSRRVSLSGLKSARARSSGHLCKGAYRVGVYFLKMKFKKPAGSAGLAVRRPWGSARAEPRLPGVEVKAGELPEVNVRHVDVERLALVDEGAPVGGHVHQHTLLDLPHRLVQRLQVVRDVQVLDSNQSYDFLRCLSFKLRFETQVAIKFRV